MEKIKSGYSNYFLKILASCFMLADHLAAVFNVQIILQTYFSMSEGLAVGIQYICRAIGRMSFPIFAFLIAEGCKHTHSLPKYIMRLAVFALISEIPFELAAYSELRFDFSNIFVTLTLGALSCAGYAALRKKHTMLVSLLPLLPCMGMAVLLSCDYGVLGVLLIFSTYPFTDRKKQLLCMAVILFGIYLVMPFWTGSGLALPAAQELLLHAGYWLSSLFSLLFLLKYDGTRGKHANKFFFYIFFPSHLLLLYLLKILLL